MNAFGKSARWVIVDDRPDFITIRDIGPWDQHPTVTNDAEAVVEELAPRLGRRRLFYFDSDGSMDELLVRDGKFAGYRPGPARRIL